MLHKRERFLRIRPSTMAARCSAHGASLCEATIPNAVRGILLPRAPRSQPLKEPKRKAVSAQKRGGPSVGTIVSRKSDAAAQIAERPAAARPHATPAGTLIQSKALYQSAKRAARHFLQTEAAADRRGPFSQPVNGPGQSPTPMSSSKASRINAFSLSSCFWKRA